MKRITALLPEEHMIVREILSTQLEAEADLKLGMPPAKVTADPIVDRILV